MEIFLKENKKDINRQFIIIAGCAGSGKTTVGRALAKRLGYVYIDKDTVTRDFTDFILIRLGSSANDRESSLYKEEILPIEYKVTFNICREILENQNNVVLTIPFISQINDYSKWELIRSEAGIGRNIDVHFIWIKHDIDAEKRNIINRNATRDGYKLKHWDEYANSVFEIEPDNKYEAYVYVNDCDTPPEETIGEMINKWKHK